MQGVVIIGTLNRICATNTEQSKGGRQILSDILTFSGGVPQFNSEN
jgi:hypothetical protein